MRAFLEINKWNGRDDKVGNPVTINPNHILKIDPCYIESVFDPRCCEITLTDGSNIFVKGEREDVVDAIELAENCYTDPSLEDVAKSLNQIKECLGDGFSNL